MGVEFLGGGNSARPRVKGSAGDGDLGRMVSCSPAPVRPWWVGFLCWKEMGRPQKGQERVWQPRWGLCPRPEMQGLFYDSVDWTLSHHHCSGWGVFLTCF